MRPAPPDVAGLILAAGRGSRMEGAHKLLLPFGDATVVGSVARAARAAGLAPVVAVVGHEADAVQRALAGAAEAVPNPRHEEGSRGSLAVGIAALASRPTVRAAVVLLGDEPGVDPAAIRRVVEAWRSERPVAVRVRYRDRPGHPLLLDRSVFARLAAATGGGGVAAGLADLLGEAPREVRIDAEGPVDVDTREDHLRALDRLVAGGGASPAS